MLNYQMTYLKGRQKKKTHYNFHLKKKKDIAYCMSIKAIIPDGFHEGLYIQDKSNKFLYLWKFGL